MVDDPESSSEEDVSAEAIGAQSSHRPITRSVSAKRAADEMEDSNVPLSPTSLHPRKVQRRIRKPGRFLDCHELPVTNLLLGPSSKIPLFIHSSSPEPVEVDSTSDTMDASTSSHLDKDYLVFENPWSEKIKYF